MIPKNGYIPPQINPNNIKEEKEDEKIEQINIEDQQYNIINEMEDNN